MLTIDKFQDVEKLVRERKRLMEFLADAKVAAAVNIQVPSSKKPYHFGFFTMPSIWLEDERIEPILVVARKHAAAQIAEIEEKIAGFGVALLAPDNHTEKR